MPSSTAASCTEKSRAIAHPPFAALSFVIPHQGRGVLAVIEQSFLSVGAFRFFDVMDFQARH